MKKLLGIIVLGLLLSGNAYAATLKDLLQSKKKLILICEAKKASNATGLYFDNPKKKIGNKYIYRINFSDQVAYSIHGRRFNVAFDDQKITLIPTDPEDHLRIVIDRTSGFFTRDFIYRGKDGRDAIYIEGNCEKGKKNKF